MPEQTAPIGHNIPPPARTRDVILAEWQGWRNVLTDSKKRESALREELRKLEFSDAKAGTNRIPLSNGYKLKAVIKYNYKITKNEKADPADYSHLPLILRELPERISTAIIKWKPELNESLYKNLSDDEQKIVNRFLLITNGSTTLTIEEPKVTP